MCAATRRSSDVTSCNPGHGRDTKAERTKVDKGASPPHQVRRTTFTVRWLRFRQKTCLSWPRRAKLTRDIHSDTSACTTPQCTSHRSYGELEVLAALEGYHRCQSTALCRARCRSAGWLRQRVSGVTCATCAQGQWSQNFQGFCTWA